MNANLILLLIVVVLEAVIFLPAIAAALSIRFPRILEVIPQSDSYELISIMLIVIQGGVLVGYLLDLAIVAGLLNSGRIISDPLFLLPAVLIGFFLFRFRRQHPFVYGLLELAVGVLAIYLSINSLTPSIASRLIGLSGGLYIMVRGLDNMEKRLPSRFENYWYRLFPKREEA